MRGGSGFGQCVSSRQTTIISRTAKPARARFIRLPPQIRATEWCVWTSICSCAKIWIAHERGRNGPAVAKARRTPTLRGRTQPSGLAGLDLSKLEFPWVPHADCVRLASGPHRLAGSRSELIPGRADPTFPRHDISTPASCSRAAEQSPRHGTHRPSRPQIGAGDAAGASTPATDGRGDMHSRCTA